MLKKRYFILSPSYEDAYRMEELRNSAKAYYGEGQYEEIMSDPILHEKVSVTVSDGRHKNASLLLIGVSSMAMSLSDSVFVAKDWENDDHCKALHMLAFSHGLDIVYEPK